VNELLSGLAIDAFSPPRFDIVAIGASAGGIEALKSILGALPGNFPVPIVVVQHIAPHRVNLIPKILKMRTSLDVREAEAGQVVQPATVYVAPPAHHLLIRKGGVLTLSDAPKIHFLRPAVDPFFESLASVYGTRAIGVVLTGGGSDGSAGARAIKNAGGRVLVQDRSTSLVYGMPAAAVETHSFDFVLPLNRIASALVALVMLPGAADVFQVSYPPPPYLVPSYVPRSI
jgi:two-component system chemotaxis response regulator CheB